MWYICTSLVLNLGSVVNKKGFFTFGGPMFDSFTVNLLLDLFCSGLLQTLPILQDLCYITIFDGHCLSLGPA